MLHQSGSVIVLISEKTCIAVLLHRQAFSAGFLSHLCSVVPWSFSLLQGLSQVRPGHASVLPPCRLRVCVLSMLDAACLLACHWVLVAAGLLQQMLLCCIYLYNACILYAAMLYFILTLLLLLLTC
ncbi:hypothetical protein VPH35_028252 [Triticum aestivum]|uniref:Uncharacterized protein n=1 Tax=Triticum turgidum subsp. durum TaxID=4567 RepID=A0A9R1PJJ6_TRITD|nr:unnamed protein product [Triticum turgidum subsp. durum]